MIVVDCAQYSAEWWEARRGLPTASEFHRIVTTTEVWRAVKDGEPCEHNHRSKSGAEKCAKKLGGEVDHLPWDYTPTGAEGYAAQLIADLYNPFYGCHEGYVSHAMASGSMVEPEARRFHEFTRGVECQQVGFITTDDGRFGCSPDSLVGDDGGLECKAPQMHTHVKWLMAGGVPFEHLGQCHGCMAVTGRQWWDFLSYCPPLPHILIRVERDAKTDKLAEHLEKFWTDYQEARQKIESQQAPPPPPRVVDLGGGLEYEETFHEPSPF